MELTKDEEAATMNMFAHLLPVFSIIISPSDHHDSHRYSQLNLLQPFTVRIKCNLE